VDRAAVSTRAATRFAVATSSATVTECLVRGGGMVSLLLRGMLDAIAVMRQVAVAEYLSACRALRKATCNRSKRTKVFAK
jgi:hypothetical protein